MDGVFPNMDAAKKTVGISLEDFWAYMPMHNYIYAPGRSHWPGASVNSRLPAVKLTDADGQPVLGDNGKQIILRPSAWLDRNKPVEQMTWAPGQPMTIRDRLILDGGWIDKVGATVFNLYRSPETARGNPACAGPWLDHIRYIYPDETDHIINWLAHRIQQPQDKINHALVLGGSQGIGKDTLLEPIKYAIGAWNFAEVSPQQILGRFNSFLKSVILRVSEARDLGEFDRFALYDHLKTITAAPPDTLRIDEKHLREYYIVNCCGVVITTNHKNDGIYLSPDDRRHFVGWSSRTKEDPEFQNDYWGKLWDWYQSGGVRHVAAYLRTLDLSKFDAKAPPPTTAAFWSIVDSNRSTETAELADAIDKLGNPSAFTLVNIRNMAMIYDAGLAGWLDDKKSRRVIPHRLEECGYSPVRNPDATDGLWRVSGKRQVIYAKSSLPLRDQLKAAVRVAGQSV